MDEAYKQLSAWFEKQTRFKSQADLAKELGVSRKSAGRYIDGSRIPPPEIQAKLYQITGLEVYAPGGNAQQKAFHLKLRKWWRRQEKFKTYRGLAGELGVNKRTIERYFAGELEPRGERRERLLYLMGETRAIEPTGQPKEKFSYPTLKELEGVKGQLQDLLARLAAIERGSRGTDAEILRALGVKEGRSNAETRANIVRGLFYLLGDELEFFKRGTIDDRSKLKKRLHPADVGYMASLLRALYDEDFFKSWARMTSYNWIGRRAK